MDKQYKVRTIFIFLLFCSGYIIIILNLYLIQIRQNDFFKNLGKKQYNVHITRKPTRAPIFDRTGKQYLAMNKDCYSAFIIPKQIKSPQLLPLLKENFPDAFQRLQNNKDKNFMFIQRKLNDNQIALITQKNIPDIHLLKEPSRFYPLESAGPVVGITNIDNKGLFGIELIYDKALSGKPTTFYLEKDARSGHFHFKKETKIKGKEGKPVFLTIDSDLQFLVTEELKENITKHNAKEGAVIIMDPKNGDILSMVSYPSFNPNETQHLDLNTCKNKIITESYELGSVIKVFAALAAIDEEVVTLDEIIDCQSKKTAYIDGRKINTIKAHGFLSFSQVVEKSNNIGIAIVAKRIGTKLYDHYKKVGFGEKTNIKLPGEQKGIVNHPNNWSKQSVISLSYGYEISSTLLQLAKAFCMIARNGINVHPKILLSSHSNNELPQRIYSEKSINKLKKILENTTLRGTARRARIKGYKIMCKTGTANLLVNGQYSQNHNIFTCAGIVEKNDYQRVILTFLKEVTKKNVYSETVVVPLFEKIAEKTLIHDKII